MPRFVKQKIEFEGRTEEREVVIEGDDLPGWPASSVFTTIGAPIPRVDGVDRVRGAAEYTADLYPAGVLHGVFMRSPHPHARVTRIDAERAERMPGVRVVYSHTNTPQVPWHGGLSYLFDPVVRYVGDEVAAVIAESPEVARDALDLIDVAYEILPHVLDTEAALQPDAIRVHPQGNLLGGRAEAYERGNVENGLKEATTVVALTVRTPEALHHSMETHVSVAQWVGERLLVWDSTQNIFGVRRQVAATLGLALDKVRVISPFTGGGFGSKTTAGKHTIVAALASRQTGTSVKFMFTRAEESLAAGKRPASVQKIRMGARADGVLTAIDYWGASNVGAYRAIPTPLSGPANELYACQNVRSSVASVFTHTGPALAFRAPGYVEGTVALECAMEALADRLGVDPLELRLRNYAETDQVLGRPYSGKYLREAYNMAAQAIGWERREPTPSAPVPGSSKYRGLGMATQIWGGAGAPPAYADLRLNADGTAEIRIGTQDIGTGTKTALAQIAAEVLALPMDKVRLSLGDTEYPYSPLSAGSQTVASCGPAVRMAAEEVRQQLVDAAASALEAPRGEIRLEAGRLSVAGVPDRGVTIAEIAKRMGNFTIAGHGFRAANPDGMTIRTFGAQFAEVEVDAETGQVAVLRVVACHDVGRVINPLQYESQVQGGIIQGVGLALYEEHMMDPESGTPLDLGFDTYTVPRAPHVPPITSLAVGQPDRANSIGAKGAGEPPIIPTPAAVANAVANALGLRLTELPLTPLRVYRALRAGTK